MKMIYERMLARCPPFQRLDPPHLHAVLGLCQARRLTTRALVFDEGQPAHRFHLLLSGNVRLLRTTAEGEQIIVLHVSAGEMLGLGAPLGQATRRETAVAVDDCVLLSWPNRLWQVFANTLDGFARESMRAFAARTDEMSTRIVELSTKSMEQRIACALLRLIDQSGRAVNGGVEIGFPISRQNIADMTGSTLHSVSRVLSEWERQGMIDGARCRIVVTDPQRLGLISTGPSRPAVRRAGERCEGIAVP